MLPQIRCSSSPCLPPALPLTSAYCTNQCTPASRVKAISAQQLQTSKTCPGWGVSRWRVTLTSALAAMLLSCYIIVDERLTKVYHQGLYYAPFSTLTKCPTAYPFPGCLSFCLSPFVRLVSCLDDGSCFGVNLYWYVLLPTRDKEKPKSLQDTRAVRNRTTRPPC